MSDVNTGNGKSNEEIFLDLVRVDEDFRNALKNKDTDLTLEKLEAAGIVVNDDNKPRVVEALENIDWAELGTLDFLLGGVRPEAN